MLAPSVPQPARAAPRRRGPPAALRLDTPAQNPAIMLSLGEQAPSTLSSAASETSNDSLLPLASSAKPRTFRNMKNLSLALSSSASSSSSSLPLPSETATSATTTPATTSANTSAVTSAVTSAASSEGPSMPDRPRRPSIISLPSATMTTSLLSLRKDEDGGSPTIPYADGPVEILPGIWLGSEDNARDFDGLADRSIRAVLNVAKEVASPFDVATEPALRPFASAPNLPSSVMKGKSTFHPEHRATGRPGMHYLKMDWSHGQADLIKEGFPVAMAFVDQARERGDGVLIHCQCGISRSATMMIALVMRAAATSSTAVPQEVWGLKGMHAAYAYVKQKSKCVGPNMSLIYQLLEYERVFKGGDSSPAASDRSSVAEEEEEWSRRRLALDEMSQSDDDERESAAVAREAAALDKAMEERVIARKSSGSSATSGGLGMGAAWKSRYGGRRRAGSRASVSSNRTSGSVISEDLVEEDEEQELLGLGSGHEDGHSLGSRSPSVEPEERTMDSEFAAASPFTPRPSRIARPPPSAPATKTSFSLPPPPMTAIKAAFDLPLIAPPTVKPKRRPQPLGLLPPVPPSPLTVAAAVTPQRTRTQSCRPPAPPTHLRNLSPSALPVNRGTPVSPAPAQTLFVFPPSPTLTTRTPSTLTLFASRDAIAFPAVSPPRVSKVMRHGRTRSFVSLALPATPTLACSRVDARGWFGADS